MICSFCESKEVEAIGYSIFEVIFECQKCDEEFDIVRDYSTEHIVKRLKREMGE